MSSATERYIRWYAHLPPDAPLDLHAARALLRRALADQNAMAEYLLEHECAPSLLGEFINRHWTYALDNEFDSHSARLVQAVMRALALVSDDQRGVIPSTRLLRQLCKGINDAR